MGIDDGFVISRIWFGTIELFKTFILWSEIIDYIRIITSSKIW